MTWTEHTTPDNNRTYWHNKETKQSVWKKPQELKSPAELALDASVWKQFQTKDGRNYWNNSMTKQSVWQMPQEYAQLVDQVKQEQQQQQQQQKEQMITEQQQRQRTATPPQLQHLQLSASMVEQEDSLEPDENEMLNFDEFAQFNADASDNEKAFINLLKYTQIRGDMQWEDALRVIISNPLYRLLATSTERKQVFEKYREQRRLYERELNKIVIARNSEAFLELMHTENVSSLMKYSVADKKFQQRKAWKAFKNDNVRRDEFEKYIAGLRRQERDKERELRTKNMAAFENLLKSITEITEASTWEQAEELFKQHPDFKDDLLKMSMVDCLTIYQDRAMRLDREASELRRQRRDERLQEERNRRFAFKELLLEHKNTERLNVYTKWKELYNEIKEDQRFIDILGQPGSSALELYRDTIVDLEEDVYTDGVLIKQILKDVDFIVMPTTDFEEFSEKIAGNSKLHEVHPPNIQVVFDVLKDKAKRRMREELRSQEKRLRRHYDDFKFMLKRSDLPITPTTKWDDIKHNFMGRATFEALAADEASMLFAKYLRRMSEKMARQEESRGERMRKRRRQSVRSRTRRGSVSSNSSSASSENGGRAHKLSSLAPHVVEVAKIKKAKIDGDAMSSEEEGAISE